MPIYPLYALLFAGTGLSGTQISLLFALWSTVAIVAEVPSGALADRFSRRGALVAAGVLQAAGYAAWMMLPGFTAFAAGFVLWGLGGSLVSGALEALLYDGLAAVDARDEYPRVLGWVTSAGLVAQLPTAGVAAALFSLGGFSVAGWASVASCLAAAALATRIPEAQREPAGQEDRTPGYLDTLRSGLAEVAARPVVRTATFAVAALFGLDAFEEYFPLLARDWGVPTGLNPLALLVVPAGGAAGAALGGLGRTLRPYALACLLGVGVVALAVAGLVRHPLGLAGVAVFYGLYRLVLVVAEARLQERIEGPARATVTSVAALGSELVAYALYAAWALGGVLSVAGLVAVVAAGLPRLLRVPTSRVEARS